MDSNSDNNEEVAVTIRFPRSLHGKVKALSRNERRSFNSQVLIMLETCLSIQPKQIESYTVDFDEYK